MTLPPPGQIVQNRFGRSSNSPRYLAPATRAPCPGEHPLVLEPFRHFAIDDALGQPSTMAVLPTPGAPISTGLFLVRRLQHLDGAANFVIPADHRVELAEFGPLGESMVYFSSAWRFSSALASSTFLPPRTLSMAASSFSLVSPGRAAARQGPLLVEGRQHEEFGRDELILALLGQLVADVEQPAEAVGELDVPFHTADAGQAVQLLAEARAQGIDVEPGQG